MNKRLGIGMLTVMSLLVPSLVHADEISVPFAIYVEDFRKDIKQNGMDLDGGRESQGFVEERGGNFTVFTYKQATPKQLGLITDVAVRNMRK